MLDPIWLVVNKMKKNWGCVAPSNFTTNGGKQIFILHNQSPNVLVGIPFWVSDEITETDSFKLNGDARRLCLLSPEDISQDKIAEICEVFTLETLIFMKPESWKNSSISALQPNAIYELDEIEQVIDISSIQIN